MTLTHDRKLLTIINISTLIFNFVQVGSKLFAENMIKDAAYVVDIEVQLIVLAFFCIFSVLTSRVDTIVNSEKLNKIKNSEEEQRAILNRLLQITSSMNTVISDINSNVNHLETTSNATVFSMNEITQGATRSLKQYRTSFR